MNKSLSWKMEHHQQRRIRKLTEDTEELNMVYFDHKK